MFTLIKCNDITFMVSDAPEIYTIPDFVCGYLQHEVKHIVRTSELSYDDSEFKRYFTTHDLVFTDCPTKQIITEWLTILDTKNEDKTNPQITIASQDKFKSAVLIAIAMMELHNMSAADVCTYIRKKFKYAFTQKQLEFLFNYKKTFHRHTCTIL